MGIDFDQLDRGSVVIIDRYLYGLKYSGSVCGANLSETLNSMGYISTKFELDVWFKRYVKPSGDVCYKCMLYMLMMFIIWHIILKRTCMVRFAHIY